jgi:adenylate cyclase
MARRLAAIIFTDIAGYTALAQADEAGALKLLHEQDRLVRPILEAHRGRKVKSIGDGLLLEFQNVLDAVECGVELQRRVRERNAQKGAPPLRVRVGIHLGDVQPRGTDILGDAVNIASRVVPLAEPGGVCLSAQVFDQVHNKVSYQLESLGPRSLKGVREPIGVYRVVMPWPAPGATAAALLPPRLAVLPLTNISPDPRDEYFADGMTEELISVLSQIRGLRVIARTSVSQYKGTTKPIAQIGSELRVSSILEGSVRKADNQLRISVQLIDVGTEEHRWAQTYDRKLENIFAIQAEVAERTANALKVALLKSEREAIQERPTTSLVAYEHYLRGIQAFHRFELMTAERADADREAVRCFEAAIREDPQFTAAYSYLANHLLASGGLTRPAREVFPRARELVAKALELNPNSSDAHTARGNLAFQADLDWTRAEAEFQQAIALNPSSSAAHMWYGYLLWVLQRFAEAKKQNLAAIELDPLWRLPRVQLGVDYEDSGEYDAAIGVWKKMGESFGDILLVRGRLAWAHAFAGRVDEAVKLVEPLERATDQYSRTIRSGVLAYLERPEELRALVRDWEAGRSTEYVSPVARAGYYAQLGEKEKALELLEQDCREGDKALWARYLEVFFDPIRDDPRFVAMIRAMKLPTKLGRPLRVKGSRPRN